MFENKQTALNRRALPSQYVVTSDSVPFCGDLNVKTSYYKGFVSIYVQL